MLVQESNAVRIDKFGGGLWSVREVTLSFEKAHAYKRQLFLSLTQRLVILPFVSSLTWRPDLGHLTPDDSRIKTLPPNQTVCPEFDSRPQTAIFLKVYLCGFPNG